MLLLLLALAVGQAARPAPPVAVPPAEARAIAAAIEAERAKAQEWLRRGATSYLATVARVDFGERPALTVGRAPGNDVRLDAADVSAHHLRVTVEGDRFRVEAVDPAARFVHGGRELRQAIVDPSGLGVGRFLLRLSHQRSPAIIVFDPESPRLNTAATLKYFPVDLAYRYELPLTPNPTPETVVIMSTLGHQRQAQRVGWFDFLVGNTPCRLEVTRLLEPGVGEHDLIVLFRDATSGGDTYPLGRYIDPRRLPDGRYLLDFNAAYNPACAFSDHYNCPIPPRGNTLGVAIRAGETDPDTH
jgi:uncharacterized protein